MQYVVERAGRRSTAFLAVTAPPPLRIRINTIFHPDELGACANIGVNPTCKRLRFLHIAYRPRLRNLDEPCPLRFLSHFRAKTFRSPHELRTDLHPSLGLRNSYLVDAQVVLLKRHRTPFADLPGERARTSQIMLRPSKNKFPA